MKNNAIYPGTFDPITYGHIDVIKKALKIVDTVIVAISDVNNKNYLFANGGRKKYYSFFLSTRRSGSWLRGHSRLTWA